MEKKKACRKEKKKRDKRRGEVFDSFIRQYITVFDTDKRKMEKKKKSVRKRNEFGETSVVRIQRVHDTRNRDRSTHASNFITKTAVRGNIHVSHLDENRSLSFVLSR